MFTTSNSPVENKSHLGALWPVATFLPIFVILFNPGKNRTEILAFLGLVLCIGSIITAVLVAKKRPSKVVSALLISATIVGAVIFVAGAFLAYVS